MTTGTPRGIRLNNPGNIRRGQIAWVGMAKLQTDPDFIRFQTPEHGFRAMVLVWLHYRARGISTLREIVTAWAPPSENDTAAYLADLAQRTGFHPDAPLDVREPETALALAYAFTMHENRNTWPYDAETVRQGIAMALTTLPIHQRRDAAPTAA